VSNLAFAGDVNGDGLGDLVLGVPERGDQAGGAYVVFGKRYRADLSLADLEEGLGGGFVIAGAPAGSRMGSAVAGGVDVNGDGLDDLVIGAPGFDQSPDGNEGAVYVAFGQAGTSASTALRVMTGSAPREALGTSVAGLSDQNGDGLDEVVAGSPGALDGRGLATVFLGGEAVGTSCRAGVHCVMLDVTRNAAHIEESDSVVPR
jgi:hypothetical protein